MMEFILGACLSGTGQNQELEPYKWDLCATGLTDLSILQRVVILCVYKGYKLNFSHSNRLDDKTTTTAKGI